MTTAHNSGVSHADAFVHRSRISKSIAESRNIDRTEKEEVTQSLLLDVDLTSQKEIMKKLKGVLEMTPEELENWDSFMIGKAGKVTSSVRPLHLRSSVSSSVD